VYGSVLVVLLPLWSQDVTDALSVGTGKVANNLPLLIYGIVLALAMLVAPHGVQGAVSGLGRRLRRAR
jgi:ABC-type branched-subunit amino acid transport system permease subunit